MPISTNKEAESFEQMALRIALDTWEPKNRSKVMHDSGPYDITVLNWELERFALRLKAEIEAPLLAKAAAWDKFIEEWPGGMDELESATRTSRKRYHTIINLQSEIKELEGYLTEYER